MPASVVGEVEEEDEEEEEEGKDGKRSFSWFAWNRRTRHEVWPRTRAVGTASTILSFYGIANCQKK
jgi:hypothetical protein